jgi:hypothetical protein
MLTEVKSQNSKQELPGITRTSPKVAKINIPYMGISLSESSFILINCPFPTE